MVYNFNLKKFTQNYENFIILFIYLILLILFSFFIYIFKNPVIRMNYHVLISINLILVCMFFNPNAIKVKKHLLILFMFIGLMFNFMKNFNRIYQENFINNPYMKIESKIAKTSTHKIGDFTYYQGWYGKAPIGNQVLKDRNYKKKFIFDIIY